MNKVLDMIRDAVRSFMLIIAKGLNKISGGRITPAMVTLTGLFAHVYIAYLIAMGHLEVAAVLLIVFGLFDALDGQLARLQNKASNAGMLLDATTDRMKEVLLYTGAAWYIGSMDTSRIVIVTVLASGGSLLVSYVKAKGETAVKDSGLSANEINKLFADGFSRFEIRMSILVIGLLLGMLLESIIVIAILTWYTATKRLITISRKI